MKIAVASTLPDINSPVGDDLHCSKYLLIINPDTMDYKIMLNPFMVVSGPAMWKLFTQELLNEDVRIVLAGNYDPDTSRALRSAGIQIFGGINGPVHTAVEQFEKMDMADTVIMPSEDIQE